MAKNKITRKDIAEDKIFTVGKDFAKALQPGIEATQLWESALKELKAVAIEYNNIESQFKVAAGRKEFLELKQKEEVLRKRSFEAIKAEQTALVAKQKVIQASLDTEKKGLQLASQKIKVQERNIKLTEQEKLELRILNRGKREAAVLSSKLSTEYEKQAVRLTQLRRRYKDVALTQGESSKEARRLQREIAKLDATLKRVDANVGQFQRNVGNYGKAMASARTAARNLASALGLVGGAFLAVQVARDATRVIRDFEKQNATLSAILQVEKEDMKGLTDEAIRLGATTVKTAGEVTALQIAYARLGFSQAEIIDQTEATIQGSISLNSELENTANLVGAIVNTFDDLATSDAPQIIDILSLATAKSALNFEKLETALPIVSGAANAANIPFTKLVALLGKLADSGIDASSSSTALRNIFIESAAQGLSYEEILDKIKNSTDKLTASNDEFGKRAAVSATVLSDNIEKTNELDEALNKAAGTAERMANKELDTLDGSLKLLRSAWEGYVLGVNESGGASEKLKNIVKLLADNLEKILDTTVKTVKAFVIYKAIMLSISLITRAATGATVAYRIAKIALTGGIKKATIAMKAFNLATKSSPIGLVLGLIAGGVATWLAFRDGAKEATGEMKSFNDELERLQGLENRFAKALDGVTKGTQRANAAVAEQDKILNNLDKVLEKQGEGESLRSETIKRITNLRHLDAEAAKKYVDEEFSGYTEFTRKKLTNAIVVSNKLNDIIDENLDFEEKKTKEANEKLTKEQEKQRKIRLKDAFEYNKSILQFQITSSDEILKDENTTLAQKQIANIERFESQKKLIDLIKSYEISQNKGRTDKLAQIELEYNNRLNELQEERKTNGLKFLKADFLLRKKQIEDARKLKEQELQSELKGATDKFNNSDKTLVDVEAYEKEVLEIKKRYALLTIKAQIDVVERLLASEKLSIEERKILNEQLSALKIAYSETETDQILSDYEKQKKAQEELKKLKEEFIGNTSQILADSLNLDADNLNKFITGITKGFEGALDAIQSTALVAGDIVSSVYDRNIEKLDEQIQANRDFYAEKLDNELLSEEQRSALEAKRDAEENKLEQEKRKERKKQATAEKAFAALDIGINTAIAVSKAVAASPLTLGLPWSAIIAGLGAASIAAVIARPIPKFAKGTDNAPEGWAVVDENVPEVHTDKHGKIKSLGSDKGPNLRYLEQGDKIYKSHDDYKRLLRASMLTSVEADNKKLNDFQTKHVFDYKTEELVDEMRLTRLAIEKHRTKVNVYNNNSIGEDLAFLAELNKL